MSGASIAIVYLGPWLIVGLALLVLRLPAVCRLRARHAARSDWLGCDCGAGLPRCDCAIDGTRNPRGRGRGRMVCA